MEILQNLDDSFFETWNLETVLDAANQTDRIYIGAHVFEQTTDKRCTGVDIRIWRLMRYRRSLTRTSFRVFE
jgi:hypothetical protein